MRSATCRARPAAGLGALLVLAACATVPPAGPAGWPERRSALQSLDAWTLQGRLAVAAANEGFSGGLEWRQQGDAAEISLRRPLGAVVLRIDVAEDGTTVTDDRGVRHDGEDARRFLEEQLGHAVPLPVSDMRYWLVGAPSPHTTSEEVLGEHRRLASLRQAGWHVQYEGYETTGALVLPRRIEMTSGDLRLRVVVSSWRHAP